MRIALAIVVPIAAAVLQATVVPALEVSGARPNLLILAAACWALAVGAGEALWWAFIGGLAADILSAGPLGGLTVSSLPGVLMAGLGERSAAKPIGLGIAVAGVGLAALLAALIYAGVLALVGQPASPPGAFAAQTLGSAVYTALLAIPGYPLAQLGRRLTETESPF